MIFDSPRERMCRFLLSLIFAIGVIVLLCIAVFVWSFITSKPDSLEPILDVIKALQISAMLLPVIVMIFWRIITKISWGLNGVNLESQVQGDVSEYDK